MNNKVSIIVLSGVDGVGKSAIKKLIEQKTNYKYIVLDRFLDSVVYDKLYNREDREELFLDFERKLADIANVYLVYLTCKDKKILNKRLSLKNESITTIDNIRKAEVLYEDYLEKTPFNQIILDTSDGDEFSNSDEIIKQIAEIEKFISLDIEKQKEVN